MRALLRIARRLQQSSATAFASTREASVESTTASTSRLFSKLPGEYEIYYGSVQQAIRRPSPAKEAVSEVTASAAPDATIAASTATPAGDIEGQRQSAAAVSRWMFPWEKRQMDSKPGPLKAWERLYWGVFVGAIALLLFNRLLGKKAGDPADLEAEQKKEERRLKAARLLLAGQTFSREDDDDEFEGLSPQEIQAYVDKALGQNASSDPFEGMSPEEINALLESSSKQQDVG